MGHDLRCLGCGAPLSPEAADQVTTCTFCGASAAPPPKVIEQRVERVVVVRPVEDVAAGRLRCPRCAEALHEADAAGAHLYGCRGCGGLLVDNATVERLRDRHDPGIADAADALIGPVIGRARRHPGEISCPLCGAGMRRVHDRTAEHHVDICDAHGTWFDGSELSAFVRAFAELRAGDVDDSDLAAAGIPGGVIGGSSGGEGFFSDLWFLMFPRHRTPD